MGANTKIEWCDYTFNPWIGCTKVDELCDNCYAETLMDTRYGRVKWGPGHPRSRTSEATWKLPRRWNAAASVFLYGGKRPARESEAFGWRPNKPRVFCASLADWLDPEVSAEWRADLLVLIAETPNLDWLLLTKRPGLWRRLMLEVCTLLARRGHAGAFMLVDSWLAGQAPANVWVGTSVGTQKGADVRVPQLLQIPARVRFLSCEPLLEAVNLGGHLDKFRDWRDCRTPGDWVCYGIQWVICGGESGPKARPMHPDWARSLRDQCAAAGVPFFFKQWGEWTPGENVTKSGRLPCATLGWGREWVFGAQSEKESEDCHADDSPDVYRVGKAAAGRLLDGVEHNAFPEVRS